MSRSIMQTKDARTVCWGCGCTSQERWLEEHHVFGASKRKHSEHYGLKVYLCYRCHRDNKEGIHGCNTELRQRLFEAGQQAFEREHGTREEFMQIFGRNYL